MKINVCDHLQVNLTSKQALRLYNATKAQYKSIEQFLAAEWSNLLDRVLGPTNITLQPDTGSRRWSHYLNDTQAMMEQFVSRASQTWEKLMNISDSFIEMPPAMKKAERKVMKNLNKLAKGLSDGLDSVKAKFGNGWNKGKPKNQTPQHSKDSETNGDKKPQHPGSQSANSTPPPGSRKPQQSRKRRDSNFNIRFEQLYKVMKSSDKLEQ